MLTAAHSELDWELEASRRVGSITAPMTGLSDRWEHGPRTYISEIVKVEQASSAGLEWLRDHPGTDRELESKLGQLFASQSLAIESLSVAFRFPRPTAEQLEAAGEAVTESMRSVADSLDYLRNRLPVA